VILWMLVHLYDHSAKSHPLLRSEKVKASRHAQPTTVVATHTMHTRDGFLCSARAGGLIFSNPFPINNRQKSVTLLSASHDRTPTACLTPIPFCVTQPPYSPPQPPSHPTNPALQRTQPALLQLVPCLSPSPPHPALSQSAPTTFPSPPRTPSCYAILIASSHSVATDTQSQSSTNAALTKL
jgi:hypothetical protein